MVIFSIQIMMFEILSIKLIKHYEYQNKKYSTIQSLLYINKSYIILIGLLITLLLELFEVDLKYTIIGIVLLMLVNIYNELKLITYLKKNR